jgi:hypothetical protein
MKVIVKPVSGDAQAHLERAREELTRVLGFRGNVVSARVSARRITLEIAINPRWNAPFGDKVSYLKEWIPAKMKVVFRVISISAKEYE